MFHWDDMRIFLAVVRTRRITTAARLLNLDATTISRRLGRLAETLNAQLFEQIGAERILTDRGLAFLKHAERAEEAALAAVLEVKGETYSLNGHVRLSVAEGFGSWIVAPGMRAFREQYPGIHLDIITASGFLNPSKREADMAVMLARPSRGRLSVRKLGDYNLGLYASRAYLEACPHPLERGALGRHVLIGYVPDFNLAPELDYLDELEIGLTAQLRSTSINMQVRMIMDGAGIGVLPRFIAGNIAGLVPLLADEVRIVRHFYLVIHEDLRRLPRIRAVADFLEQRLNACPH